MTYKLISTALFIDNLNEVTDYISCKLHNPSAAQKLLNKVSDTISLIGDNPYLFPLYHNDILAKRGYRYTVVSNYLLLYQVDEIKQEIYISRFLHGGRNITDMI